MNRIKIGSYMVGAIQTNFYYIYREDPDQKGNQEAVVFDPADMGDVIFEKLTEKGIRIKGIFLTHGHFDHIMGCQALREKSGAPVYAASSERRLLSDPVLNESASCGRSCTVEPDYWLEHGEEVETAGIIVRTLHTPGHTEGSCAFYIEEAGILISGDTLFYESVGRTDLPTGSMKTLVDSVRNVLFALPDETEVYPGHGEMTSIGHEKKYNYFL